MANCSKAEDLPQKPKQQPQEKPQEPKPQKPETKPEPTIIFEDFV